MNSQEARIAYLKWGHYLHLRARWNHPIVKSAQGDGILTNFALKFGSWVKIFLWTTTLWPVNDNSQEARIAYLKWGHYLHLRARWNHPIVKLAHGDGNFTNFVLKFGSWVKKFLWTTLWPINDTTERNSQESLGFNLSF